MFMLKPPEHESSDAHKYKISRNCTVCQCSQLRQKFMECDIITESDQAVRPCIAAIAGSAFLGSDKPRMFFLLLTNVKRPTIVGIYDL